MDLDRRTLRCARGGGRRLRLPAGSRDALLAGEGKVVAAGSKFSEVEAEAASSDGRTSNCALFIFPKKIKTLARTRTCPR